MLSIFVVLAAAVATAEGLACRTNIDCMMTNAGCCRVDGTVIHGQAESVGVCGAYIQESDPCATGFPIAYINDCRCADGLVCFPDQGSYQSGTCRTQKYVDQHGGFPIMPIGK